VAFDAITAQEMQDRTRGEDSKRGSPRVFPFLSFMGVKRSVLHWSCEADDGFYLESVKKKSYCPNPWAIITVWRALGLGNYSRWSNDTKCFEIF